MISQTLRTVIEGGCIWLAAINIVRAKENFGSRGYARYGGLIVNRRF